MTVKGDVETPATVRAQAPINNNSSGGGEVSLLFAHHNHSNGIRISIMHSHYATQLSFREPIRWNENISRYQCCTAPSLIRITGD